MPSTPNFGSYTWGQATGGSLSFREKAFFVFKASTAKLADAFRKSKSPVFVDFNNITLPDSGLVWEAYSYAKEVHEMPLVYHSLRTYLLGVYFAQQEGLTYDAELLALAALFHNLGLEKRYFNRKPDLCCFAIEGAQAAGKWLQQNEHNLAADKIALVQDAIARHLNVSIPSQLPEAYLLNKASGTDAIGLYRHEVNDHTAAQLLTRYPNEDRNQAIFDLLSKEVEHRPDSRMALLYKLGFGKRVLENRFEQKQK